MLHDVGRALLARPFFCVIALDAESWMGKFGGTVFAVTPEHQNLPNCGWIDKMSLSVNLASYPDYSRLFA